MKLTHRNRPWHKRHPAGIQRASRWFHFVSQKLRSIPSVLTLSVLAMLLLGSLLMRPSQAAIAQITPPNPQLGDTISVLIQGAPEGGTQPQVKVGPKTYSAFPRGNNRYQALVPTTPLSKPGPLTLEISNGTATQNTKLFLKNRWFPTQSIWLPPGKDGNLSDAEFDRVDAFKQIVSPQRYWQGPMLRPNSGAVTSIYGVRRYYNGVFASDYFHRGVDYGGGQGSAILAPAGGKVALICRESEGFQVHGNCVGLDHGQGVESIFIHMSQIYVKQGDVVQAGQKLGTVGSTGSATGPHLHWGLFVFGDAVDPVPWREKGFG